MDNRTTNQGIFGASLVFVSGLPLAALLVFFCMIGAPVDQDAIAQAKSDGALLLRAINEYKAVHGTLPPNIEILGIELGPLPYRRWEYRRDSDDDSFWLHAGCYDDGFTIVNTSEGLLVLYDG